MLTELTITASHSIYSDNKTFAMYSEPIPLNDFLFSWFRSGSSGWANLTTMFVLACFVICFCYV